MVELIREGFVPFFAEVTGGLEPFPWQVDLVERLMGGRVPEVIDVPTGLGKTSIIHCWAYAAAATLDDGAHLPRRLFFVVDRRLVVDGAYEAAEDLQRHLTAQDAGPLTGAVAQRLQRLHGDASLSPLTVVRMRGGTTWESRWLPRPDQAAVVVGTVDQFGSRLLFRGYGTSPRMRPIDAALTGTDAWLVIDEAHIAAPLVQTTSSVAALQQLSDPVARVPGLAVTQMSATTDAAGEVLRADLDEQTSSTALPHAAAVARRRLDAQKPVTLVDLSDLASASRKTWRRAATKLGVEPRRSRADRRCRRAGRRGDREHDRDSARGTRPARGRRGRGAAADRSRACLRARAAPCERRVRPDPCGRASGSRDGSAVCRGHPDHRGRREPRPGRARDRVLPALLAGAAVRAGQPAGRPCSLPLRRRPCRLCPWR